MKHAIRPVIDYACPVESLHLAVALHSHIWTVECTNFEAAEHDK